jgi:release factor glutamine methyltransferase
MKFSEILIQATKILDAKGVNNSKLDSLILLIHTFFVLGESITKEQIIFNPETQIDAEKQKVFFDLVARRAMREPISHIINNREFFGADFFVNSAVLDPRPDSESLIELVLKIFPEKNKKVKILELGVGSGCLMITLLKALPEVIGSGVDISKEALLIAQKNAEFHEVENRLQLRESDLFAALKNQQNEQEKFDLIISNPPYIATKEIESLQEEVKNFEPRLALDGGMDGLDFYRRIAAEAKNFLYKNGKIILEVGFNQKAEVVKIFTMENFSFIEERRDLSGVERALCFQVN